MKKTYQIPDTDLTLVNVENLLQTGTTLPKGSDDDVVTDEGELLSRRHNTVWDDEEEEEY